MSKRIVKLTPKPVNKWLGKGSLGHQNQDPKIDNKSTKMDKFCWVVVQNGRRQGAPGASEICAIQNGRRTCKMIQHALPPVGLVGVGAGMGIIVNP